MVSYRGAQLTTNPPPSFGGSIVCSALTRLDDERGGLPSARALVEALHDATLAQKARTAASVKGTTHVSVIDSDGMVASMTTSNGSCSGVLVPGTGSSVASGWLGNNDDPAQIYSETVAATGQRATTVGRSQTLATRL